MRHLTDVCGWVAGNACFLGLSVVGTVRQCLRLGNARAANRVRSDMRMSDRRYTWLKVGPGALG